MIGMATLTNHRAPVNSATRIRPGRRNALKQLLDIQRRLYETSQDRKVTASALAQVARAWSELEERKRILRMKPAPKPVDVSMQAGKSKRRPVPVRGFFEPEKPGVVASFVESPAPD